MNAHSDSLSGGGAPHRQSVSEAIRTLRDYCESRGWAGHDPYDALNSRLLRRFGLFNHRVPRLGFTQLLKRCPVNFRRPLLVPREQNPKGIAVFLAAHVRLFRLGMATEAEVRALAARLLELRSAGQAYSCWGYNFDWQTRTYLVPRFTPNIICTTFAANALLDAHEQFHDPAWLQAAQSAASFLLEGLNLTREGECLCFSYTPLDRSQVHNASLLGAALLARLHACQPHPPFAAHARAATRFALSRQRPDGSWPYGESARQQWIDSFHTGYNLMALDRVRLGLGFVDCESAIHRGYQFYLDHFFAPGGVCKYFHNRTWPVDVHSIAQALITLSALADRDPRSTPMAGAVCAHALREMRSPVGAFYYQKWPWFTNRISYMRWSQSWMLLALTTHLEALTGVSGTARGVPTDRPQANP